ncbi:MAG: BatD family protein [Elusimicrobia bacterium]|nr:BatD family protein [Candidatus Obscuribacterium magneticum]
MTTFATGPGRKNCRKICFGGLLLFLLTSQIISVLFAEPKISASVSATELTLNDSITLKLEISGVQQIDSMPNLQLPGFVVQPAGQTQSFQWINGQTSSMIALNFVLTPTRAGSIQIPSITLSISGQNYSTDPINIVVTQGSGATPSGGNQPPPEQQNMNIPTEGLKPVFMTAEVDKSRAYVGEEILLSIKFLRQPGLQLAAQPQYFQPEMTGFISEPMKQQEYTTSIQGVQFVVTELRYALFPTSEGEFAIGSAQIDLAVRTQGNPFDADSFFQNFFGRAQQMRLKTRPIPVNVRALPKDKPANFSGAIGRLKITARTDTTDFEVGKPFNLIVNIEGKGNVRSLKEPFIPAVSSLKRYESISNTSINSDGKYIFGNKEFKILMIPQVSGTISIPPIEYVYFNPESHHYLTDSTPAISLNVKPGTKSPDDKQVLAQIPVGQSQEGVRVVEKDIRFLKSGKIKPGKPPLYFRQLFFVFNVIPLIFALGAFFAQWQYKHRTTFAAQYRSRGALKKALKKIKKAGALISGEDPIPFYGLLYSALAGFLADKFGISASGMLGDDLGKRLDEKGVDQESQSLIRGIWEEADMVRFAASTFDQATRQTSLQKTQDVLTKLNKVL